MFDLTQFFGAVSTGGIPLLLVVLGLVQFVKGFGLQGNAVKLLSLFIGLAFGIGYQYSLAPIVGFAGWFTAVVFGLLLGLVASGIYKVANPSPQ